MSTQGQREVLRQLFLDGPTWDGDIVSKPDRDELVGLGLAERVNGFNFITRAGMETAEAASFFALKNRRNRRRSDLINAAYRLEGADASYGNDPANPNIRKAWTDFHAALDLYANWDKP